MDLKNIKSVKTNNKYISFSNYDVATIPKPFERKNRAGWVDWGTDNLYPNYLINLTHRSAIHNAIINLKASMIAGNGFINADWSPATVNFITNASNYKDDLEVIMAKVAIDLTIFGGYALEVVWSNDRTKITTISHVPLETIRIEITDDGKERYFVCDDWRDYRKNVPVVYDAFSTTDRAAGSTILYVKEYRAGGCVYPEPEYLAGITLCELNAEINDFHLNTVKNQFSPSQHINIPYEPQSDEEREEIVKRMKDEYKGAKNAGNVIISFSSGQEGKPTIETISMNDSDKRFKELTTWMRDGIFSAHQITDQSLLGIETPGRLGGRNNLLEALAVFQAQYVSIKQQFLERQLSRFTRINLINDKLLLEKYKINIDPDIAIADLVLLLSATLLTPKQKVNILLSKGFTREKALELVDSANVDDTPLTPPAGTAQPPVVPKSNLD